VGDRRRLAAAFLALLLPALPVQAQSWSTVQGPTPGPARVIGTTGLGCLAGAVELAPEGPGYQVVRLSRNRNWGHPELIRFVQSFAARSGQDLWIGDLGQPRGGPMPYGHASHQAGIDVDIWLDLRRKPAMTRAARENISETSLVLRDQSAVDPARFTEAHARLIRQAAETPGVERIFVNHGIKRSLCAMHRGEPWLRLVRPWFGHDAHMHVRLRCPAGSPDCRPGPVIPAGDGCDAGLAWWMSEDARRPRPRPPGPRPQLPAACAAVLRAN